MLLILLCCMIKIIEFSKEKLFTMHDHKNDNRKARGKQRRKKNRQGKTMNEVGNFGGVRAMPPHSPDSDCNSNHHANANSYLSNTSSQDMDFIQDNSDYQWFLDYGYRDGGTNQHHTSILSLPESYETNDLNYYDTLSKNMDANLAEADMESFRTEDIHALLTNLPPMCTDHLSQENNRQGECFASVSGSMMAKLEFDNSSTSRNSSRGEDSANSMSICKSELLFSPVKEAPPMPGGVNFSVDSLDCDMMLTCQANKDNYTIAFEGSVTMYSEDSDYHETDKNSGSAHWPATNTKKNAVINLKQLNTSMTQSDSGSLTTWSKLKKLNSDNQLRRHPSGNNNNSGEELTSHRLNVNVNALKSQSMPNLYKQKLKTILVNNYVKNQLNIPDTRKAVKVFDIQHQLLQNSVTDMATSNDASSTDSNNSNKPNFSLVKLFMKQKSQSTEKMSTTMDQLSSTENWPISSQSDSSESNKDRNQIIEETEENSESAEQLSETVDSILNSLQENHKNNNSLINRSIQTSQFSEILNLKNTSKVNKPQLKVIEPSFLNRLKKEGEKPVYVLYPNYVLPNLDFLKEDTKIHLVPQEGPKLSKTLLKKRPFSCNDIEQLKKTGFSHIKDWESLNFLLPQEYRRLLADVPEISEHFKPKTSLNGSSSSQPSSGYRGSSTILNEPEPVNPLFVYRYDSVTSSEASLLMAPPLPVRSGSLREQVPPRPPLPKGILRKRLGSDEEGPLFMERCKRLSETEDEGVDAGTSMSSLDENQVEVGRPSTPGKLDPYSLSSDELVQLGEFLKMSGMSSSGSDEESLIHLRSYVDKFLSLKINQEGGECFGGKKTVSFAEKINVLPKFGAEKQQFAAPNNSPNVSAFMQQRPYQPKTLVDMPICEENESSYCQSSPQKTAPNSSLQQKQTLIGGVTEAVKQLLTHFSVTNQADLEMFNDSISSKMVLSNLCPALYAVLSDGLKPCLESSFGAINNSVWQVVEASAQQGPLTKSLNELVMRINSEDVITEGLLKFNAFIFGLLNVRSLDAWVGYLRTRETIIKKHYQKDALLVLDHLGGSKIRSLLDNLIETLQPLAMIPFQIDLLYEFRQLHYSFKRMDSYLSPVKSPNYRTSSESEEISVVTQKSVSPLPDLLNSYSRKERPRSCIEPPTKPAFKLGDVSKKRWSGIALNSKLYLVYDKLAKEEEEEYADSLENTEQAKKCEEDGPESLDSNIADDKPIKGKRFRKLQQKWEMLSGQENISPPFSPTHTTKSKIPRPVCLSPVKPSGIPVPISPTKPVKLARKLPSPTSAMPKIIGKAPGKPMAKKATPTTRTSRVDLLENANSETTKHMPRPSSLPYKATPQNTKTIKTSPPRRAASSSLSRRPLPVKNATPKVVRTLAHRVPSESGHLPYSKGERLKVVLEVDDKWLLCCRGVQKGLVPKSAVITDVGCF